MSRLVRRPSPQGVALAGLALAVLLTFGEALLPSRVFFERDIHAYWYPHRAALREAVAEAGVPLWNPWVGFGAPFLADASSELAYPPTWLTLSLPLPVQFELFAIGHSLLAAAGAFFLARRLSLGPAAAAVAGGGYALAGPLVSALGLYHHFAGAAWMPWVLWALEGLLRRPGRGATLVLGLAATGQVLAGSGDLVLMTALVAGGRLLAFGLRRPSRDALAPVLRSGALAAALALSLGAVQWLPTMERALHGFRAGQDLRTRAYWSLHPRSLVDLAVPRLVEGAALASGERDRLFEGREPLFAVLYVGVVTITLAVLALVLRAPRAFPLVAGLAAFVMASLGRHTPIYAWLLALPGLGLIRYPQKYLLPASLCLALLAALGAQAWGRDWSGAERRRARALAALLLGLAVALCVVATQIPADRAGGLTATMKLGRSAFLAALVSLLFWRRGATVAARPVLTLALLLLGAADLVAVGRAVNPLAPRALYEHRPVALDRLAGAEGRIHAAAESPACLAPGQGPPGWQASAVAALGFLDTLRPPAGIRWGLRGSYDGEFTGLGPRWAAPFSEAAHARLGTRDGLRLLQLGGIEHVLYLGHGVPAGLELVATLATPLACPLQLLRVPDRLPPAFVVGREREETGDALAAALDPSFDPHREVLLADARPDGPADPAAGAVARIVSRTPDGLEVEADLAAPGVLVVVEAFDEGWQVAVDGRDTGLVRANGLFRGVRLAAGRHRVSFAYRPASVRLGLVSSGLGLVVALAVAVLPRRRARD